MAKDENLIRLTGTVHEVLPNAMFRIILENQHKITAYLGGRLRQHDIKIITGDRVEIEMSPYDMSKGRIVYRN